MSSPAETLDELFRQCPKEILSIMSEAISTPDLLKDKVFKRDCKYIEDVFYFTTVMDLINTILWNAGMHVVKCKFKVLDDGREVIDGFEVDTSIVPGKRHGPE